MTSYLEKAKVHVNPEHALFDQTEPDVAFTSLLADLAAPQPRRPHAVTTEFDDLAATVAQWLSQATEQEVQSFENPQGILPIHPSTNAHRGGEIWEGPTLYASPYERPRFQYAKLSHVDNPTFVHQFALQGLAHIHEQPWVLHGIHRSPNEDPESFLHRLNGAEIAASFADRFGQVVHLTHPLGSRAAYMELTTTYTGTYYIGQIPFAGENPMRLESDSPLVYIPAARLASVFLPIVG